MHMYILIEFFVLCMYTAIVGAAILRGEDALHVGTWNKSPSLSLKYNPVCI